jgi:nitroreductase
MSPLDDKDASQVFEQLLQKRRSIRIFNGEAVPDDVVQRAIELALLSPSSSNLQPWQFFRIKEHMPEARVCFLNQTAARTSAEIIVAVARPDLWRTKNDRILAFLREKKPPHFEYLMNYHGRLTPFSHDIGTWGIKGVVRATVTWLIGRTRPVLRQGFFRNSLREVAVKSTALACQTLMLALTAQGYDSCPLEGFDYKRLKKMLGLPSPAVPIMGIAIGKRHPTYVPPMRFRFDYHDTVVEL